ncbi:MAG TPA: hypothetical protein VEA60_14365, partial [Allosphingosinicella sp.]|nr:hypothetical protein [Allosphingosinicella sp.]
MRLALRLGTAAVLALAASALAAQPLSVAEDWSDADYSTKEVRALTHAYAQCVVRRHPAKAAQAIAANADNATLLRDYRMLIDDECLSRQVVDTTQMRFTGDLYRYALADALVNRELAAQPVPALESVPKLEHRNPGPPPQPVNEKGKKLGKRKLAAAQLSFNRDVAYAFLSHYGECVVRADTAGAKALLVTKPDSAEETARFTALRPAFSQCLPAGRTLRFGKVALRGSVAINYY